ncbi:MAG: D-alanyl-D-alanine carboxypeptidase, partial [Deltaproteobacteria bacterium]
EYKVVNGSGLSRGNKLTAHLIVQLLCYVYSQPEYSKAFIASLPIMGVDGTLGKRHKNDEITERIRAKTGSLDDVSAISGYATTKEGRTLAFSLLINKRTKKNIDFAKVKDRFLFAINDVVINDDNK